MTRAELKRSLPALERFRALVLAEEPLQFELAALDDPARFIALAIAAAASHGLILTAEDLRPALALDPLGLARLLDTAPPMTDWPSRHWLPTHVGPTADGRIAVDWSFFGRERLVDPFFGMSAMRVTLRPFNRIWRYRMTLDDFLAAAPQAPAMQPRGFIFHMSRCGSTLVAQMLAAMQRTAVVSEAAPLDTVVQLNRSLPGLSMPDHARILAAMIGALGRPRFSSDEASVFKLDSWHTLALPLFRYAFPSTPWVFLYREPHEVIVSQMRQRGLQAVPGVQPSDLYGIVDATAMPAEDYCARVLDAICAAAVANLPWGGGCLVNYDALPDAVTTTILPHFGMIPNETDRAAMRATASRNAKAPHVPFVSDRADKQRGVTAGVRAAVAQQLHRTYAQLEVMRQDATNRIGGA